MNEAVSIATSLGLAYRNADRAPGKNSPAMRRSFVSRGELVRASCQRARATAGCIGTCFRKLPASPARAWIPPLDVVLARGQENVEEMASDEAPTAQHDQLRNHTHPLGCS